VISMREIVSLREINASSCMTRVVMLILLIMLIAFSV